MHLNGSEPRRHKYHTGIFYHPSFSRRSYLTQGSRLEHFPHALNPYLNDDIRYHLYESPAIDEKLILQVHSAELLRQVKLDPLCSTGWHSVGGVVLAAEKVIQGEIHNAFAFIGAGGHHSGRNFFGGYCCFNDVVIAIQVLRESHGIRRFAILDTDAHHGDGTRDLLKNDAEALHVCLCSSSYESSDGTKVDVPAPSRSRWFSCVPVSNEENIDALYAETAAQAFGQRVRDFGPEMLFWYFGFDTHQGDYGDLGLSVNAYLPIAQMMRSLAEELCRGRLEVVLGGGSRSDIARTVIPPIIEVLGTE